MELKDPYYLPGKEEKKQSDQLRYLRNKSRVFALRPNDYQLLAHLPHISTWPKPSGTQNAKASAVNQDTCVYVS